MAEADVVLLACGDVGPVHEPMAPYSTLVRPLLATGDIRFGQCERIYSKRGSQQVHGGSHSRVEPHLSSIFSDCGFDVLSVASNHTMDFGGDALLDSIETLHKRGIQTVGGGRDLEEARKPALIERNGVKVAILGYCSILKEGFAASPNKPGIAPLRAHTYYRPQEYQPGLPSQIVTVPYEEDMQGMVNDVTAARKIADVVLLSVHWGIHYIPRMIADYQVTLAKTAFAAGVDLILGHHAHLPKAIEVHAGKVCFYSLSNFIMSRPSKNAEQGREFTKRYGTVLDPEYPNLPYGPDAKRSMIAKVVLTRQGVRKTSFLPVIIDKQLRPEVIPRSDPRFQDAVNYMEWVSEGFDHKFALEGDEVVVTAT